VTIGFRFYVLGFRRPRRQRLRGAWNAVDCKRTLLIIQLF
jgi:hypothetical protein